MVLGPVVVQARVAVNDAHSHIIGPIAADVSRENLTARGFDDGEGE